MKIRINNSKLNLTISIIMFMVMMAIAGIGFLNKYALLAGFKRNEIYGSDVELYFLGLDRHQWGSIHLILGFVLLFLLLLHIIFHWSLIVSIFKRMVSGKASRVVLVTAFVIFSLVFGVMPLFVKPEVQEWVPHYYNQRSNIGQKARQTTDLSVQVKPQQSGDEISDTITTDNSTEEISGDEVSETITTENLTGEISGDETYQERNHKQRELHTIEIDGTMTLNEVSAKYNIPATELASCIDVPKEYTNERLGRLRRRYGFHMDDLRVYIESKNKNQE